MFDKLTAKANCYLCQADVEIQYEKSIPDARREAFALVEKFTRLHNESCSARLKRLKTW